MQLDAYLLEGNRIDLSFGRDGPLLVEIGFGNGHALARFAQDNPDWNCVGVEVFRSGLGSLVNLCLRDNLTNVRIVEGEGLTFLESLGDNSIEQIWVLFPDPWPKRRHSDRRMISTEFGDVAGRKLKMNGKMVIATDWQDYADAIDFNLGKVESLKGGITANPVFRTPTKYEKRGQRLGHRITNFEYFKVQ